MSPFVKLDCATINSTLWLDRDARDVFLTALLLATPDELTDPTPELNTDSLEPTGWYVPSGAYGIVHASGPGIVAAARLDLVAGMAALKRLAQPEGNSRSRAYDGRRLVRIDGCYVVLNYMTYRDKDYTNAARQRLYRERKRNGVTPLRNGQPLPVTQADAEADAKKKKPSGVKRLTANGNAVWLVPFHAIYAEQVGAITYGRLGKSLKPVREAIGDEKALAAFKLWCVSPKESGFGPEWFSAHFKQFDLGPATDDNGAVSPAFLARMGIKP